MTWLDGIPTRTRAIEWPLEAETFRERALHGDQRLSCTCLLDDRICTSMAYQTRTGQGETGIYLGDIRAPSSGDTVAMEQIALLPFHVVSIALLTRGDGDDPRAPCFVSIQSILAESELILRLHARDGSVLKQQSTEVSAAFGQLIVHGNTVAICVSSGEEPEDEPEYFASDSILQYRTNFVSMIKTRPRPGYPDTILVWNLQGDVLHEVPIPQHEDFLMLHQGDFAFVSQDKIALAGMVEQSVGDISAALLKSFTISDNETEEQDNDVSRRTFTQPADMNAEIGQIYRHVGKSGSSESSDIFLHYYSSSSRLSVFHKDLLSGKFKVKEDRHTLVPAINYPSYHRSFRAKLTSHNLPSIAGNRTLIRGILGAAEFDGPQHLLLLDFEPSRVGNLLKLDEPGREGLREHLKARNASVKVITRRVIHYPEDEDEDGEYVDDKSRPAAWKAHLEELRGLEMERLDSEEGEENVPSLEYDEAPEEHRDQNLFGCSATVVRLPEGTVVENVGLTTSALVETGYSPIMTGFGSGWRVFEFTEE